MQLHLRKAVAEYTADAAITAGAIGVTIGATIATGGMDLPLLLAVGTAGGGIKVGTNKAIVGNYYDSKASQIGKDALAGSLTAVASVIGPGEIASLVGFGESAGKETAAKVLEQVGKHVSEEFGEQFGKDVFAIGGEQTLAGGIKDMLAGTVLANSKKLDTKKLVDLAKSVVAQTIPEEAKTTTEKNLANSIETHLTELLDKGFAPTRAHHAFNIAGGGLGGTVASPMQAIDEWDSSKSLAENLGNTTLTIGAGTAFGALGGGAMSLGFAGLGKAWHHFGREHAEEVRVAPAEEPVCVRTASDTAHLAASTNMIASKDELEAAIANAEHDEGAALSAIQRRYESAWTAPLDADIDQTVLLHANHPSGRSNFSYIRDAVSTAASATLDRVNLATGRGVPIDRYSNYYGKHATLFPNLKEHTGYRVQVDKSVEHPHIDHGLKMMFLPSTGKTARFSIPLADPSNIAHELGHGSPPAMQQARVLETAGGDHNSAAAEVTKANATGQMQASTKAADAPESEGAEETRNASGAGKSTRVGNSTEPIKVSERAGQVEHLAKDVFQPLDKPEYIDWRLAREQAAREHERHVLVSLGRTDEATKIVTDREGILNQKIAPDVTYETIFANDFKRSLGRTDYPIVEYRADAPSDEVVIPDNIIASLTSRNPPIQELARWFEDAYGVRLADAEQQTLLDNEAAVKELFSNYGAKSYQNKLAVVADIIRKLGYEDLLDPAEVVNQLDSSLARNSLNTGETLPGARTNESPALQVDPSQQERGAVENPQPASSEVPPSAAPPLAMPRVGAQATSQMLEADFSDAEQHSLRPQVKKDETVLPAASRESSAPGPNEPSPRTGIDTAPLPEGTESINIQGKGLAGLDMFRDYPQLINFLQKHPQLQALENEFAALEAHEKASNRWWPVVKDYGVAALHRAFNAGEFQEQLLREPAEKLATFAKIAMRLERVDVLYDSQLVKFVAACPYILDYPTTYGSALTHGIRSLDAAASPGQFGTKLWQEPAESLQAFVKLADKALGSRLGYDPGLAKFVADHPGILDSKLNFRISNLIRAASESQFGAKLWQEPAESLQAFVKLADMARKSRLYDPGLAKFVADHPGILNSDYKFGINSLIYNSDNAAGPERTKLWQEPPERLLAFIDIGNKLRAGALPYAPEAAEFVRQHPEILGTGGGHGSHGGISVLIRSASEAFGPELWSEPPSRLIAFAKASEFADKYGNDYVPYNQKLAEFIDKHPEILAFNSGYTDSYGRGFGIKSILNDSSVWEEPEKRILAFAKAADLLGTVGLPYTPEFGEFVSAHLNKLNRHELYRLVLAASSFGPLWDQPVNRLLAFARAPEGDKYHPKFAQLLLDYPQTGTYGIRAIEASAQRDEAFWLEPAHRLAAFARIADKLNIEYGGPTYDPAWAEFVSKHPVLSSEQLADMNRAMYAMSDADWQRSGPQVLDKVSIINALSKEHIYPPFELITDIDGQAPVARMASLKAWGKVVDDVIEQAHIDDPDDEEYPPLWEARLRRLVDSDKWRDPFSKNLARIESTGPLGIINASFG